MKRIIWIGRSHEDLEGVSSTSSSCNGICSLRCSNGEKHESAKVLSGMGSAKIIEIRENDRNGTYRIIYSIEMEDAVIVLHAFQKKSKSGIATPKQEIEILKNRLKEARIYYKSEMEKNK